MSRGLSAQGRKSISDVLRRKAHSIVILLAILIPVGGFTAVSVAGDSLSSAYAFSVGTHGNRQDTVIAIDRSDPALLTAVSRLHNVAAAQVATWCRPSGMSRPHRVMSPSRSSATRTPAMCR